MGKYSKRKHLSTCNIASIGGGNYSQGRKPNNDYWTIVSTNETSTIVDGINLAAGTENWTGAQVVMRKSRWIMDKYTITSASGSTINFNIGSSTDEVQEGYGYFIMNDQRCLDQANEWSYNSSTNKLSIYSTSSPTNVMIPTVENGIDLNGKEYITIDNISFSGFNNYAINAPGNDYIKIENCDFSFIGNIAIYQYLYGGDASNCFISGCTFTDIGSMGIYAGFSSNSTITNNTLLRIGRYPGMGGNGDVSYSAIVNVGNDQTISYNSIRATGYCGIRWDGNSTMVKGNFVDSTTFVKDDGGGIYVVPQLSAPSGSISYDQRTVSNNIVLNCIGAKAGGAPSSDFNEAMCIYNDGTSPNVSYINNTVAHGQFGIFSNAGHDNIYDGNTGYDCKRILHLNNYGGFGIANLVVKNNILVAKTAVDNSSCGGSSNSPSSGQYPVYWEPQASGMPASFQAFNNVYARPIDETNGWIWRDFAGEGGDVCSSLSAWKTKSGQDAGSTSSPFAISDINDIKFVYNETSTDKQISLGGSYIDLRNNPYCGNITLAPYSSAVLLTDPQINQLNLKLFLEGFYTGSNTMRATLYDLSMNTDPTVTDTITVNLWSLSNQCDLPVYSMQALLHTDGTATLQFPNCLVGNSYYIAVKHRNSIETWSKLPVTFSSTTSYDFSTALSKAYDDGVNPPMANVGVGVYAIYGGDVNQDGTVDASDMAIVDNDNANFAFGYNASDVTGDGATDASDLEIVDNNQALFLFFARPVCNLYSKRTN